MDQKNNKHHHVWIQPTKEPQVLFWTLWANLKPDQKSKILRQNLVEIGQEVIYKKMLEKNCCFLTLLSHSISIDMIDVRIQ